MQLSARGRTQREIAAEVGVSQSAVCKIIRRTEDRLLEVLHRERIRLLVRLYARTEHVYRQAQDGWERSCADRQRRTQRRMTSGGTEREVVEVRHDSQPGDPRFLREQLRVVAEHRSTFKLDDLDWGRIAEVIETDADDAGDGPPRRTSPADGATPVRAAATTRAASLLERET